MADLGTPAPALRLRMCPNPISGNGVVEWVNDTWGPAVLRLYDAQGRLVLSHDLGTRGVGLQGLEWGEFMGKRDLVSGVYFLDLEGGWKERGTLRVVVVR